MKKAEEIVRRVSRERLEHGFEAMEAMREPVLGFGETLQDRADLENKMPGSLGDGVDCKVCLNRGSVCVVRRDEETGREYLVAARCKCMAQRAANRALKRSGLESAVKRLTFEAYQTPHDWQVAAKEAAERFCKERGGAWFFIGGQSGAGKTHLCTAIAGELMRAGMPLRYMLWRDEIARIKSVVYDYEELERIMSGLKRAKVLYIDDLFKRGKGPGGDAADPTTADIDHTFEVLNTRYLDPALVTIISSERTLDELMYIDEAVAGRIAEKTKGVYCINLRKDPEKNWRMGALL